MSPRTSNQIVSLAEVSGHEYASGVTFQAGHPMAKHALVGVLNPRRDVLARELVVGYEHRVAYIHLAKRDVHGVAFASVARRERGVFFDSEHGGFPLGWVSKRIVKGELTGMHTEAKRYHLPTSSLPPVAAGGSACGPELAQVSQVATTSTTYYLKRRAREGVLVGYTGKWDGRGVPAQYDAKRSVAVVRLRAEYASGPVLARVPATTTKVVALRLDLASNPHKNADWIKRAGFADNSKESGGGEMRGYKLVGISEFGSRVGETHHRAKLSDHDVDLIRSLRDDYGLTYQEIADKFEIGKSTVRDIVKCRRRWQRPETWKKIPLAPSTDDRHAIPVDK